jgi:DNA-binding response OmpR family regulator
VIEDNPGDARIVQEFLSEEESISYKLYHANLLTKGLNILSLEKIDVILCDLGLPDSNGIETFKALQKANYKIPIIVLTGMNESVLGLTAIKMGADDFLVKGQTEKQLLIRSINYAIERKNAENRQKIIFKTLFILNQPNEWRTLIKEILVEIKQFSQFEEVAIQLQNGDDFQCININASTIESIKRKEALCIDHIVFNVSIR